MARWKKKKRVLNEKILVDKSKWGVNDNTHAIPPEFYLDIHYNCCDCGTSEIWTASEQKHYYEELGKTVNSGAVFCRDCRMHIAALKEDQKRHMQKKSEEEPHPNEKLLSQHITNACSLTPKHPRFCVTRCAQTLTQKHSCFGAAEAGRYMPF